MPDVPSGPDEAAALRAANARLRQVVEAKDVEISVLREQLEALAAQVAELHSRLGQNSLLTEHGLVFPQFGGPRFACAPGFL